MAEGPQICDPRQAMVYVDKEIDAMSNTELLDRISDAITTLTAEDKTATPTSPLVAETKVEQLCTCRDVLAADGVCTQCKKPIRFMVKTKGVK
jgi:hypothetical protein